MSAMTLPEPGSVEGPCKKPCEHRDCAETRTMAAQVCRFCEKPIGYGARIYKDPQHDAELVHALCLEIQEGVDRNKGKG